MAILAALFAEKSACGFDWINRPALCKIKKDKNIQILCV
jgi:hypothetical protein